MQGIDAKTIKKAGILLSLEKSYPNGKLKNIYTHFKVLKRVGYGYRNFSNMRARIFLTNNLIKKQLRQKMNSISAVLDSYISPI
ncbi:transposase [Enterococcus timonensis]|uniref:transposase n=1 Tax=Enterococcus timonensis TaxID=1852364 RepID=UPI000D08CA3B